MGATPTPMLLPAMATVDSAGRRMDELSERVARTADLLRLVEGEADAPRAGT